MHEEVAILIILIATAIPCLVAYGLIRFAPRARYLPSVLLGIVGFCFFISGGSTKPAGPDVSGLGGFVRAGELLIGGVFVLSAGVAFLLSFLMYRWWRSRHER